MTEDRERALQRPADERYRKVFDEAPIGMSVVGTDLRFVEANPAYRRIVGYTLEELQGLTFADITHPDDVEVGVRLARQLFRGEIDNYRVEKRYLRRDGGVVWVDLAVFRLPDPTGGQLAIGMIQDISERKRSEQELERTNAELKRAYERLRRRAEMDALLAQVARAVASAGTVEDAFAGFVDVVQDVVPFDRASFWAVEDNRAFRVLAVAGTEHERLPLGHLQPVTDPEMWAAFEGRRAYAVADLEQGGGGEAAPRFLEAGFRSLVAVPVVATSGASGVVTFFWSRPRGYDRDDVPLLQALVHECAAGFHTVLLLDRERDVAERLRELDRLKNDFVAIVVHDMRAPMAVVTGYADLLMGEWKRLSDGEKLDHLGRISRNVHLVSERIREILTVARIDSGDIPCELVELDLEVAVRQAVEEAAHAVPDRPVDVVIADGVPTVRADPGHLRRVLRNLLANAFKFSEPDTPVQIVVQPAGDQVRVSVVDWGVGIDPGDTNRLFRKFSRLRPEASPDGTGLGLYVCKALVEAQGGDITVASLPGEGATFTFSLSAA
ncbi:MAG TPA: PAS domain S-box protein [Nitriliruptorales bacterium]|nr:PAS domain S-box protein [Nitriliruptorales bacterium]